MFSFAYYLVCVFLFCAHFLDLKKKLFLTSLMTDSNDNFDENINPDSNYHLFTQNTNSICRYMSINEYNASLNFNNYFSILSYNIRSFDKNFDSFSCGLSPQSMPDILCLSETWFSRNITSEIPGYSGYHVTRDGRSGGISLFTKKKSILDFYVTFLTPLLPLKFVQWRFLFNSQYLLL